MFNHTGMTWLPVLDDVFIKEEPMALLESGRINKVDVIIGVNKDEGSVFTHMLSGKAGSCLNDNNIIEIIKPKLYFRI